MDRESSEDQRQRQDAEKEEAREAGRERLGHVEKPKAKSSSKKKTEEEAKTE